MNLNGTIPGSWERASLGQIAATSSGGTPRRSISEYFGGSVPWVKIGDLNDGLITETEETITEAGLAESSATKLPAGTLLVAMYGSIGKLGILGIEAATNQAICALQPSRAVSRDFLYWFLRSRRAELLDAGFGGTQANISQTFLRKLTVPLPPRPEQDRIVTVIEERFKQIQVAAKSLNQARSKARLECQVVYSSALSGPWPTVQLKELLREPPRNGHSAKATADGSGIRTLTLTAVTTGSFTDANTKMTAADPARVKDLWLEPGDILVERSNTPELVGTAALYRGDPGWAIFPDLLIRVRVTEAVLPEFIELAMKEQRARRFFQVAAQGIAGSMPKISQETVMALPIPLPELEEQHRIVSRVQAHDAALTESLAEIAEADSLAESLRRATLQSAFTGRLVPQDPADEPAGGLLHEISST